MVLSLDGKSLADAWRNSGSPVLVGAIRPKSDDTTAALPPSPLFRHSKHIEAVPDLKCDCEVGDIIANNIRVGGGVCHQPLEKDHDGSE